MNVSETLKALAKSGTVTSKAAAVLIEEMLSEREKMQVEIDALELARDDLTARVEVAHKTIAAANASEVLPLTLPAAFDVVTTYARCAAICIGPMYAFATWQEVDRLSMEEVTTRIRTRLADMMLAESAKVKPGTKG